MIESNEKLWNEMTSFLENHRPTCKNVSISRTAYPNKDYRFLFDDDTIKTVSGKTLVSLNIAEDNSSITIETTDETFTVPTYTKKCVLTTWDEMLDFISNHKTYADTYQIGPFTTSKFDIKYVGYDKLSVEYRHDNYGTNHSDEIKSYEFTKADIFPHEDDEIILRVWYNIYNFVDICFFEN